MFKRGYKLAAGLTLLALSGYSLWAQAQESPWKDQAEYDIYNALTKETDNRKKITLLDQWKEKYPDSKLKANRAGMYVVVYQALNDGEHMYQATKDVLSLDPKNATGLVYIAALTVSLQNMAPDRLDYGEKVARQILSQLDEDFSDANRQKAQPAQSPDQWAKLKVEREVLARKTLLFVADARKNNDAVEQEATNILKISPNDANLSLRLAQINLAKQKEDPKKGIIALYHYARAGAVTGTGALPPASKKQVDDFLKKAYTTFHGSEEGLPELMAMARNNPFPPDGFDIKSSTQMEIEAENKMKEEDPIRANWVFVVKRNLQQDAAFFETMKDAALPGTFRGRVISVSPARRPKEVMLAMSQGATEPEVKLVLPEAMPFPAEPGTELQFDKPVAKAFTAEPFLLTLELQDKADLHGWPEKDPSPPPARGRARGTKKGN